MQLNPMPFRSISGFGLLIILSIVITSSLMFLFFWFVPNFLRFSDRAEVVFRVEAEFEIDGAKYFGSSVWKGEIWSVSFPTNAGPYSVAKGEALELHGERPAYYMLRRRAGGWTGQSYGFFPALCIPEKSREGIAWFREHFLGPCEVTASPNFVAPELIFFANPEDPASLRPVPYVVNMDGPCAMACLRSLKVSRSIEAVTVGIVDQLPWLLKLHDDAAEIVTGDIHHVNLKGSEDLYFRMDFSTEIVK